MISRRYAFTELRSFTGHVEERPAQAIVDPRHEAFSYFPSLNP
jgi:hypothetical protein